MQLFGASFGTVVQRYFLMMFIVILAGFIGQWWLSILAFPVVISAICAISFGKPSESGKSEKTTLRPTNQQSLSEAA